jgi:hypothetical protein
MNRRPILTTILVTLLLASCGGASYSTVGAVWDPREARFFDDGVDLIEDPHGTTGIFGFRQKDLLEGRIQLSDFVAIVTVQTVRTSSNMDGVETKHVDVTIEKRLYGDRPERTISLKSESTSTGIGTIGRHETSLTGRFILFSRWFEKRSASSSGTSASSSGTKEIAYHFHLTPASPFMLAEVKQRLALRVQLEGAAFTNE